MYKRMSGIMQDARSQVIMGLTMQKQLTILREGEILWKLIGQNTGGRVDRKS